jgi:hypothetical protein
MGRLDYRLFRPPITRGPLRLLFAHELPPATQVVVRAQVQLQQQMLQRRNPRRHLRQHNIDPFRQLVQPEAESGFRSCSSPPPPSRACGVRVVSWASESFS